MRSKDKVSLRLQFDINSELWLQQIIFKAPEVFFLRKSMLKELICDIL